MTIPIRTRDISGHSFPPQDFSGNGGSENVVLQIRPPWLEPPEGSKEFTLSFSTVAAGGSVLTPLFTLDGAGNVVTPSAAIILPASTQARINNVAIGGDTGPVPGASALIFSIRTDKTGQSVLPGWEGIGLPGRGGVVNVGFEPFTRVVTEGTFIGGFVVNTSGGPLYAEMILTGWYW